MAFRFTLTQYPGQDNSHGDGAWYEFGPSGILAVHPADDTRDHEYYPSHAWTDLITDQPPGQYISPPHNWSFDR